MLFASRKFVLAKDPERPEECQDALEIDEARGIAAIADGVSSAIFSGQWARLLCASVVAAPPNPEDAETFWPWLRQLREQWASQIDVSGLAWFQRAKLPMGAFSTLLWVYVSPGDGPDTFRVHCRAVGDTCLFHVRGKETLRCFPVQSSAEMDANPVVVGSVDLNRDGAMSFATIDLDCRAGDLLALCTDAVALWAIKNAEAGAAPDWEIFWNMGEDAWREGVQKLRDDAQMRVDDATLALLRLGGEPPESDEYGVVEEPVTIVAENAEPEVAAPAIVPQEEWAEKLQAASEQITEGIDKVSDQVVRGLRSLWGKASDLYRDKIKDKLPKKK